MSTDPTQDLRNVLSKLAWFARNDGVADGGPLDWQVASRELDPALGPALDRLGAARLCSDCGKPLEA